MAWQHTMWLQIKQLRIDVPAGTIHPTHQLLVRDAHSAAEFVLPSSACAAIYGVMPHVRISSTPSSTNVVDLNKIMWNGRPCTKDEVITFATDLGLGICVLYCEIGNFSTFSVLWSSRLHVLYLGSIFSF